MSSQRQKITFFSWKGHAVCVNRRGTDSRRFRPRVKLVTPDHNPERFGCDVSEVFCGRAGCQPGTICPITSIQIKPFTPTLGGDGFTKNGYDTNHDYFNVDTDENEWEKSEKQEQIISTDIHNRRHFYGNTPRRAEVDIADESVLITEQVFEYRGKPYVLHAFRNETDLSAIVHLRANIQTIPYSASDVKLSNMGLIPSSEANGDGAMTVAMCRGDHLYRGFSHSCLKGIDHEYTCVDTYHDWRKLSLENFDDFRQDPSHATTAEGLFYLDNNAPLSTDNSQESALPGLLTQRVFLLNRARTICTSALIQQVLLEGKESTNSAIFRKTMAMWYSLLLASFFTLFLQIAIVYQRHKLKINAETSFTKGSFKEQDNSDDHMAELSRSPSTSSSYSSPRSGSNLGMTDEQEDYTQTMENVEPETLNGLLVLPRPFSHRLPGWLAVISLLTMFTVTVFATRRSMMLSSFRTNAPTVIKYGCLSEDALFPLQEFLSRLDSYLSLTYLALITAFFLTAILGFSLVAVITKRKLRGGMDDFRAIVQAIFSLPRLLLRGILTIVLCRCCRRRNLPTQQVSVASNPGVPFCLVSFCRCFNAILCCHCCRARSKGDLGEPMLQASVNPNSAEIAFGHGRGHSGQYSFPRDANNDPSHGVYADINGGNAVYTCVQCQNLRAAINGTPFALCSLHSRESSVSTERRDSGLSESLSSYHGESRDSDDHGHSKLFMERLQRVRGMSQVKRSNSTSSSSSSVSSNNSSTRRISRTSEQQETIPIPSSTQSHGQNYLRSEDICETSSPAGSGTGIGIGSELNNDLDDIPGHHSRSRNSSHGGYSISPSPNHEHAGSRVDVDMNVGSITDNGLNESSFSLQRNGIMGMGIGMGVGMSMNMGMGMGTSLGMNESHMDLRMNVVGIHNNRFDRDYDEDREIDNQLEFHHHEY